MVAAFRRKMSERGWTVPGVDARQYGIPGEHGPLNHRPGGIGRKHAVTHGVWHPAWVEQTQEVLKECELRASERQEFWALAARDAEWRDGLIACSLIDLEGAVRMVLSRVRDKREET